MRCDICLESEGKIEMSFSEDELERVIEICKHMIGLTRNKPYHSTERHIINHTETVLQQNSQDISCLTSCRNTSLPKNRASDMFGIT